MKTYYVLRHALSIPKGEEYGEKILTATILPEGIKPIKNIGAYLATIPTDYHMCSEITRCKQTAQIISHITGKPFLFDKRLNEYYLETFNQLQQRVHSFLLDIEKTNYKNIVICTHGTVIAVIKHFLVTGTSYEKNRIDFPESGILTIIKNNQSEEINFNS